MEFLKNLLFNLALMAGIGLVLYLLYPEIITQVFEVYKAIFGPIIILLVIAAALPRKRSKKN